MKRLASYLLALYRREPSRANALAAGAVTWLVLRVGLDVDNATVSTVVPIVLTFIAGEATRWLVVPTATVDQVIADETRDADTPVVVGEHSPDQVEYRWAPANPDVRKPHGE